MTSYIVQIQDFFYKVWNIVFLFFMTLIPFGTPNRYGQTQYRVGSGSASGTQRRFGSIKHTGKGPRAPPMSGGG